MSSSKIRKKIRFWQEYERMYGCARHCFYTGMALDFKGGWSEDPVRQALKRSIEHLIPQSYTNVANYIPGNIVPSSMFMNVIVGSAPIKVKFNLRGYLRDDSKVVTVASEAEKIAVYRAFSKSFLDSYRIYNQYPWFWNTCRDDGRRMEMMYAYIDLLTEEEILLLKAKIEGDTAVDSAFKNHAKKVAFHKKAAKMKM